MAEEPLRIGFDPNKLTFRELAAFEDIAGVPLGALVPGTVPTARMMVAMVYIEMHRENPALSVDDIWDMNLENVDFNPTQAAPTPLLPLAAMDVEAAKPTRRAKAS